jgi:hypothetical protein
MRITLSGQAVALTESVFRSIWIEVARQAIDRAVISRTELIHKIGELF